MHALRIKLPIVCPLHNPCALQNVDLLAQDCARGSCRQPHQPRWCYLVPQLHHSTAAGGHQASRHTVSLDASWARELLLAVQLVEPSLALAV